MLGPMSDSLTLTRPDDWHVHLRDGDALEVTVMATARHFGRAIVMPNLAVPVTSVELAEAYRERILAQLEPGTAFDPLMTLYLTDATRPEEIRRAADSSFVHACKLYPSGATTNSAAGVTSLAAIAPALEAMQEQDLPLLVHGEETQPSIDVFDRELAFIQRSLPVLVERYPRLRIVFEHITTAEAVEFVRAARPGVAATLTPQHLLMNRNDLFAGGLRPHHYCLPVLKRKNHQEALQAAAISGDPRFFLGTDSAPHAQSAKESACGCAGCYSAPHALALYAQFFESMGALGRLEGFASHFGADFYGLPRHTESVTLRREPWRVPESCDYLEGQAIVPYWAGRPLEWR